MKSRPLRPTSSICAAVIVAERSPVVVCTRSVSAWTEMVSAMPPTSSAIVLSATRADEVRTMPRCSWALNPCIVTVRSNVPASRSGKTNTPSAPVTDSRVRPVPVFLMATVTPGRTPPLESVTTPEI